MLPRTEAIAAIVTNVYVVFFGLSSSNTAPSVALTTASILVTANMVSATKSSQHAMVSFETLSFSMRNSTFFVGGNTIDANVTVVTTLGSAVVVVLNQRTTSVNQMMSSSAIVLAHNVVTASTTGKLFSGAIFNFGMTMNDQTTFVIRNNHWSITGSFFNLAVMNPWSMCCGAEVKVVSNVVRYTRTAYARGLHTHDGDLWVLGLATKYGFGGRGQHKQCGFPHWKYIECAEQHVDRADADAGYCAYR